MEEIRDWEDEAWRLVDQIPAILWTTDKELKITSVRGIGLRGSDLEPQMMIGQTLYEFFQTKDSSHVSISSHVECLKGATVVFDITWKGRIYECHIKPLNSSANEVIGCIGIALDATEKRWMEAALLESEKRYRLLFERNVAGVYESSTTGRLVNCNEAFARILGYTRAEILQRSVGDLYFNPAARESLIALLAEHGSLNNVEIQLHRKDGSVLWVLNNCCLIQDEDGQKITGTIIDITALKEAQEAVRRTEELFRAIVEDQTEMIVRWKPDGTLIFVNKAYCQTFGKSYDELVGKSWLSLVAEPYREAVSRKILAMTPDHPNVLDEHESLLPDGSVCWQEWNDRGIFDEKGQLVEVQSVGRDITQRKRLGELQEKLRRNEKIELLGRVVSGVSHEVRSPLYAINTAIQVLIKTEKISKSDPYIAVIQDQVQRLKNLTEDLLDLGRPESAWIRTDQDLFPLVRKAKSNLVASNGNAESVILLYDHDSSVKIHGNPEKIIQAFHNILENALHHCSKTPGSVKVSIHEEPSEVIVRVGDDGPGIPTEHLDHIFEPFFTMRDGGVGLGLNIAKHIMESHDGKLRAYNHASGRGCTFELIFPKLKEASE